jgi:hypothetical protein
MVWKRNTRFQQNLISMHKPSMPFIVIFALFLASVSCTKEPGPTREFFEPILPPPQPYMDSLVFISSKFKEWTLGVSYNTPDNSTPYSRTYETEWECISWPANTPKPNLIDAKKSVCTIRGIQSGRYFVRASFLTGAGSKSVETILEVVEDRLSGTEVVFDHMAWDVEDWGWSGITPYLVCRPAAGSFILFNRPNGSIPEVDIRENPGGKWTPVVPSSADLPVSQVQFVWDWPGSVVIYKYETTAVPGQRIGDVDIRIRYP